MHKYALYVCLVGVCSKLVGILCNMQLEASKITLRFVVCRKGRLHFSIGRCMYVRTVPLVSLAPWTVLRNTHQLPHAAWHSSLHPSRSGPLWTGGSQRTSTLGQKQQLLFLVVRGPHSAQMMSSCNHLLRDSALHCALLCRFGAGTQICS